MRVRKIAKQLKRYYEGGCKTKVARFDTKVDYIMRMTRNHYYGLAKKHPKGSMMANLYVHKACSYYLFDDILSFWNINTTE